MAGASEVRFEDVNIYISTEEWALLEKWQRELYFEVLLENYESLISIVWISAHVRSPPTGTSTGNPVTKSDLIAWFERGERENGTRNQEARAGDSFADEGCYTETPEPPVVIDGKFEEEMAQYVNWEGTSEESTPFMDQGSPWRDERIPPLEKATRGLAGSTHSQEAAVAPKLYECQVCGDQFRLKGLLRIHHMVTLRKPSLPCPVCGICFPTGWHLNRHQGIHRLAGKDSGRDNSLDVCWGTHVKERLHFCATCGESCHGYLNFLQHQKSHEEAKVWTCPQCSATFMHQSDLAIHEESHFDEALHVSSPCGENCICMDSLKLHLVSRPETSMENGGTDSQEDRKLPWEGKREKPYLCQQCGEQFSSEGNLKKHYQYCRKERLKKHRPRSITPGHPKDRDKQVQKRLGSEARRKRARPSAGWACAHCPKHFRNRYSLFKHRQRHQLGECRSTTEPDQSVRPLASSSGSHAPVTHMEAHAGEPRCQCTFCGERLAYRDRFGNHFWIHSVEQALPGHRQHKGFTEPKRGGEKELRPCDECGKTFRKSYYPQHKAWHAGVKFKCLLCKKVFNFRSGAHRHLQQHRENGDFSTCPKCGLRSQSKSCLCLIVKIYQ